MVRDNLYGEWMPVDLLKKPGEMVHRGHIVSAASHSRIMTRYEEVLPSSSMVENITGADVERFMEGHVQAIKDAFMADPTAYRFQYGRHNLRTAHREGRYVDGPIVEPYTIPDYVPEYARGQYSRYGRILPEADVVDIRMMVIEIVNREQHRFTPQQLQEIHSKMRFPMVLHQGQP